MNSPWEKLRGVSLARIGMRCPSLGSSSRAGSMPASRSRYHGMVTALSKASRLRRLWIARISSRDLGNGKGSSRGMVLTSGAGGGGDALAGRARFEKAADELGFLDLSGRRHRHVVDDLELLRPGEFREFLLSQKSPQPVEVERRSALEHHKAGGALAQDRVGHRRDRDLRDRRMAGNRHLEIDRIPLHSTAVDELLG